MKTVMQICSQIQQSKRNAAIAILQKNKNNDKLKMILNFVYNPYIVSGISDKKIQKEVHGIYMVQGFKTVKQLLDYICEHNTGSDEVLATINAFLENKSPQGQEFLRKVITKSLKLGINAKTINKAFGHEFIPDFKVQLAHYFYEYKEQYEQQKARYCLTIKLDGFRCVIVKHNGNVTLFSRTGKPIEKCYALETALKLCTLDDFVLDGELLAVTDTSMTSKERYKKTSEILLSNGAKDNLCFVGFDYLCFEEFVNKHSVSNYDMRRNCLIKIIDALPKKHFSVVTALYRGCDYSKIAEKMEFIKQNKLEGLMINICDAPYMFKRTNTLLKVKEMKEGDFRVVDYERGTYTDENGKQFIVLGALVVEYKGNRVKVGSGYSKQQRFSGWKQRKKFIGKIIKVKYFEETQNADGEYSLRFPVFVELRKDKKKPNY